MQPAEYSPRERFWLWCASALGFVGVNGAFVFGLTRPDVLVAALKNPISLAFIVEAFLMLGLLAYLLSRWGVLRLRWQWFVGLSILGGLLFALPVVLLWPGRRED